MNDTNLKQEIEKKRDEMTQLGIQKGLTDAKTIQSSQQLDHLLNLLQTNKKD
ncbi:aspartyl-phosphate phosphatase Spo0E family protein [Bacillus sp. AK128]